MPAGRPSTYTEDVASIICQRIADGESLRSICSNEGMPATSSVFKWLGLNPEFAEQYARAREAQADAMADDILHIADTEEDSNIARVRIDARKWLAGKMKPKKYGDKIEQTIQNPDGSNVLDPVAALLAEINNKSRTV